MSILVQKFGGSSLSSPEAREHVIKHIKQALAQQYEVVVVVSAMGRKGQPYATDTLLEWIREQGNRVSRREMDMLLSCGEVISAVTLCSLLNAESIPATVLSGAQAGIETDGNYGDARIVSIHPDRIYEELRQQKVVIVTGFQGKANGDELTTLGRGGSDTSATALGAALKAERVDIFTDVTGILTADPLIVEEAKLLSLVTFSEICNLAHHGAKVIHPRAVEVAMQANLPIRVRSTFKEDEGTLVTHPKAVRQQVMDRYVTGIAHVENVTQIQISYQEGRYDFHRSVFQAMAQNQISVDFINVNPSGVVYTVFDDVAEHAVQIIKKLGYEPKTRSNCAKVAMIGGGMNGVPGVMARIVEALTEADVSILQSADSNTTIWVLVPGEELQRAVRMLHSKFDLHKINGQ
ncbi:aspartate kinase [Paenibacillus sp. J2TS4]|uniref:aspartate kinase n=1 Tax=Paenibacillus sp. J2TS4 TaxID=2807194 RepID=UPI001B1182BE|nr:aspartate kinase [Paenibacillus sp. J2TS4]GIP33126.1 aspartokinase [Paenibacillus sp. J2TS4]